MFERGDLVWVYFDLPRQKETKFHPALIISNDSVYNQDDIYICVMLSSSRNTDKFTFELTREMLIRKPKKEFSQVRCHLITYIKDNHISGPVINTVKPQIVDRIVQHINAKALEEW